MNIIKEPKTNLTHHTTLNAERVTPDSDFVLSILWTWPLSSLSILTLDDAINKTVSHSYLSMLVIMYTFSAKNIYYTLFYSELKKSVRLGSYC